MMRLFFLLLLAVTLPIHAQKANAKKATIRLTEAAVATRDLVYKSTAQGELKLHVFEPVGGGEGPALRPCVVFFFGGGWKSGTYEQFVPQAQYFASRGMVAACADYRILNTHKTTPDKAVEDAKSAIRWVRGHATELGIDPAKIIAAGGSAGGHLAACTALVPGYDAETDDKSQSAKPNALVLFNPAMNIDTLFKQRVTGDSAMTLEMAEGITPNRFVSRDTPPAILFFGTADKLKEGADEYVKKAAALGVRAEMWSAEGMSHGFFNREPWIRVTAKKMDEFLVSLGYLKGEAGIRLPADAPGLKGEGTEEAK
jgi:acetyl esterase